MNLMLRNILALLSSRLLKTDNKEDISRIIGFVISALFIISGFLYVLFVPTADFPVRKIFIIEKGSSLEHISQKLKSEEFIRSSFLLRSVIFFQGNSKTVRAGDYFFEEPVSLTGIASRISNGTSGIATIRVTVPEGYNFRDIGFLFENIGMFQAEELWEVAGFPGVDYLAISDLPLPVDFSSVSALVSGKPNSVGLEGYLFPDTYFFSANDTIEDIVSKMLRNLEERISQDFRAEIAKQGKTFHQILTMASILEKETIKVEDKKTVAGILWKRLDGGVPLQVDAALTYIVGRTSLELTKVDLDFDSRFNTYRYFGLPPGPIANPGLESIEAAIYPTRSPYWFYLSDRQGNIHYSSTFEEHKEKKFKYLR
jgi:UPF0755 protein